MKLRPPLVLCLALLGAPSPAPAQLPQKSPDELVQALSSPDWRTRADAVARLDYMPAEQRPPSYATAVIALIEREGVHPPDRATIGPGEGYGEYLLALIRAVVKLGDSRALRGVVLVGAGTSRRTSEFIAAHGDAAVPYIEEAWQREVMRHELVLLCARMLGDFPDRLSPHNRAMLLRKILDARTHDRLAFVWGASHGHLGALTPLVEEIAADTSLGNIVRSRAAIVARELREVRASLAPEVQVHQLADLLAALIGAAGARSDACAALLVPLAGSDPATTKLERFRQRLDADTGATNWSRDERRLLTAFFPS